MKENVLTDKSIDFAARIKKYKDVLGVDHVKVGFFFVLLQL